jgi:hypothetical protein
VNHFEGVRVVKQIRRVFVGKGRQKITSDDFAVLLEIHLA